MFRLFLVLLLAAPTQLVALQDGGMVMPPARTVLPTRTVVDLTTDAFGRPSVSVMINRTGPWRLAVDWGANAMVVTEPVAEAAGLAPRQDTPDNIVMRTVDVDVLAVGDARFEGIVAGVITLPEGIDGIIGFNVFADLLMTFDFPGGQLVLERGTLPPADGVAIVDLAPPDAARLAYLGIPPDARSGAEGVQPHVAFSVGGLDGSAVLDTQASGYLYLPDSLMSDFTMVGDTSAFSGRGPNMGQMSLRRIRVTSPLVVGGYETNEPIVTFRDRPGPMLGMAFMKQFVMTLDQRSGRVRLEGPERQLMIPPQEWETAQPVALEDMDVFVGIYGSREISLENGRLFLQRIDVPEEEEVAEGRRRAAPKLEMTATGTDRFALVRVPEALIEFVRSDDGHVVALRVRLPSGTWEERTRSN